MQQLLLLELQPAHVYEARPRKDKRGVDLISDALPFGRLWYGEPDAISNVIETHEHTGDFKEWQRDQNVCDYRVSRLS